MACNRRAFTLVELLAVIAIIGMVSVLVLPAVRHATHDHYTAAAADILRGAIAAAQSDAIVANQPRGIRLLPDPDNPVHFTGVVQLRPAAEYREGLTKASTGPIPFAIPYPCLMVEECLVRLDGHPTNPTYWFWNIRIGEKIRFSPSGPEYTIVGPNVEGTPDGFANVGPAGTPSPLVRPDADGNPTPVEFLYLVNGQDDDGDGFPDNGHDGVTTDYERETWVGPAPESATAYTISRRPIQDNEAKLARLPASTWIDRDRSSLPPVGPTGSVDILFHPGGDIDVLAGPYSVPSAIGLAPPGVELRISQSIGGHDHVVSILKSGKVSSEAAQD